MNDIVIYDKVGNYMDILRFLYQWDVGKTVYVGGLSTEDIPDIYIGTIASDVALCVTPTVSDTMLAVHIPNVLLQQSEALIFYVFNSGVFARIPVVPRSMPDDYAPADDSDTYIS